MKIISKNLLLFAGLLFVYTLLFRFGLSDLLNAEKYTWVWVLAFFYGAAIFATAWMTGRRDGMENFLFDAGLRWSLTTFLVWGGVSEAWFLLGLGARQESIRMVHITLLIWSGFLVLHFILFLILRKRTIKGIYKSDIFK
ncbi:MAG: hypothetical protein V2B15_11280 [Bacteroidota bacterium]